MNLMDDTRGIVGEFVDGGQGEMRVLVACEFSGIVRDAFIKRGHDAWSCDFVEALLASDVPHDDDISAKLAVLIDADNALLGSHGSAAG